MERLQITKTISTKKHDWLQFLKAEREEEFDVIAEKNPIIKKAVVELKRLSQSEEAQRIYEARQKAISDEKARTRTARNKAYREVVVNAIRMGLSNEQISELTGLTCFEIEKIKSSTVA